MSVSKQTFSYGAHTVTIETGRLARQADGSVVVTMGDTVVLVTAVGRREAVAGRDFFPLTGANSRSATNLPTPNSGAATVRGPSSSDASAFAPRAVTVPQLKATPRAATSKMLAFMLRREPFHVKRPESVISILTFTEMFSNLTGYTPGAQVARRISNSESCGEARRRACASPGSLPLRC